MSMEWKKLLSPHRLGSTQPGRITPERSPFQRDFDRVVFSGSLRRLKDKTQVFPLVRTEYVRTRLTHSLETSSIGRSLGTAVGVFVCENFDTGGAHPSDLGSAVAAAALAHDIGNPPLGHAGEEAISYWFDHSQVALEMRKHMTPDEITDILRFDGNAQGFRVLTTLEMPDQPGGMQLTCATLGAFAKYPAGSRVEKTAPGVAGKKFNYFQTERRWFEEMATTCGLIPVSPGAWCRHPLAFLLEAADDIAYLIVDFEDGQRLGLIDYEELERTFLAILDAPDAAEYLKQIRSPVRKTEYLRARIIGKLVREASAVFISHHDELLNGALEKPLLAYLECSPLLDAMRRRSIERIYNHRSVAEVVGAGFEMVSGMLDVFMPCINELAEEASGGERATSRSRRLAALLPDFGGNVGDSSWQIDTATRIHRVLDYISGMTDSYAVSLFQKLKGISI